MLRDIKIAILGAGNFGTATALRLFRSGFRPVLFELQNPTDLNYNRTFSDVVYRGSKAIENTFYTTGKAMVITSIVLSLGFYAYMMANMISVQNFGLLTGSVILFALLADLLLAPALMMVVTKRGWIK